MEFLINYGWILLVVLAQFTWATGSYIDGYLLRRYKVEEESATGTLLLISAFFGVVIATLIALTALLIPHFGYSFDTAIILPINQIGIALFVGFLEILWLIPYYYALDESDETSTSPLFQSIPIFGLLLGLFVFNETPLLVQIFGTLFIVLGALILNFEPETKKINFRVILLMLCASFIVAFLTFLFKVTAIEENFWGTSFWVSIGMSITGLMIWSLVPKYRTQFNAFIKKKDWRGLIVNAVNELIDNIAIIAFNGAIVIGPAVAIVQSTTAYQPIFILLIGWILAKLGSDTHKSKTNFSEIIKRSIGIIVIVFGSLLIFV